MRKKNKLPVFIICGKSPIKSYGGGYSTFALNLAKTLSLLGHEVYIVAVGNKNERVKTTYGTILIFKTFIFDYYTTALPSLPLSSYFFAKGIESVMKEKNMERIIIWGIGPWGLAGSILKNKFNNNILFINNYFTTIKHEWKGSLIALRTADYGLMIKLKFFLIYHTIVKFLSYFEKIVINSAEIIITNYQSTEKILIDEFHIPQSKFIRTNFLAQVYDRQAHEGKNIDHSDLPKDYLLYLSRHDPRKGINFLIRAMEILVKRKRNIRLVIAGTGQMLEANKRLVKRLNLTKWIKFVGFINNSEILLKNAKIFCFPSVEEGAGALIINEVMSLGVPIITTDCDGISEDVENMKSGILVSPGDALALANAIDRLYHNPKLARVLGHNAQELYIKKFEQTRAMKDIEKLLQVIT